MTTPAKEATAGIEPFLESGEAFRRLGGLERPAVRERYDVIVIGGGQAGLSVGYHLQAAGPALRHPRRAGTHRRRLAEALGFAAAVHAGPARRSRRHAVSRRRRTPVRPRTRWGTIWRRTPRTSSCRSGRGSPSIVCQARRSTSSSKRARARSRLSRWWSRCPNYQRPHIPAVRARARSQHRAAPLARLPESGAASRRRGAAGRRRQFGRRDRDGAGAPPPRLDVGTRIPGTCRLSSTASRPACFSPPVLRVVFHRLLTSTPIGRKARPKVTAAGGAAHPPEAERARGGGRHARAPGGGVRDGLTVLDDGRTMDVANVVWCTGFHPGFSWIDPIDFPSSTTTASRCMTAASWQARRASTSSACTFSTRCRRR